MFVLYHTTGKEDRVGGGGGGIGQLHAGHRRDALREEQQRPRRLPAEHATRLPAASARRPTGSASAKAPHVAHGQTKRSRSEAAMLLARRRYSVRNGSDGLA